MIPRRLTALFLAFLALAAAAAEEDPRPRASADSPATPRPVVAVSGDDVNLRSGPSIDYHDVGRAQRGELLVLVGEDGDWRRVRVPGGPVVYVFASLVEREEGALRGTVRAADVLMRATPARAHYPLDDQRLQRGDELLVLETVSGDDGDWLRVVAPDRVHVWIHGRYLRPAGNTGALEKRLAEIATRRLDALTDGRLGAERERARKELDAAQRKELHRLRARLAAKSADVTDAESLAKLVRDAADDALRSEARDLEKRVRELLRLAAQEAARRKSQAQSAAEAARRREIERRDEEYRRKMKKLEELPPKKRTAPAAEGAVELRGTRLVLLVDGRPALELVSLRFRLADYADRRVRVWGAVTEQPEGLARLDVTSLEIVAD